MNVTCTTCQTEFRVDPAKVPAAGVRARCSVCNGVFWVRHPVPVTAPAPVIAAKPVATEPLPVVVPQAVLPPPVEVVPQAAAPVSVPVSAPAIAPPPAATVAPPALLPPLEMPPLAMPVRPVGPAVAPPARRPAPDAPVAPPSFERAVARTVLPPFTSPSQRPAPPASPRLPNYPSSVAAAPATPEMAPKKVRVNPFLSQDPAAKARRLARALISDMVVYHPAKRREGIQHASLKRLFDEEIRKSWEEYVDQVGKDMAESTPFFQEALNEILADGQPLFP